MRMSRKMAVYASKIKIYLYSKGTVNTSVTGGLTAYAYKPSTSSSDTTKPSISNSSSAMTISCPKTSSSQSAGTVYTTNKVDLTKIKTINMNVSSFAVGSSSSYVRFGAVANKATGYTFAAAKTIGSTGKLSLDVSNLSGSYYLVVALYGMGDKSVKFTEWWIE